MNFLSVYVFTYTFLIKSFGDRSFKFWYSPIIVVAAADLWLALFVL